MTYIDKLEVIKRAATPAPWVYDDGIEQDEHTQHRARPETVGPFGADAARADDCIFLVELRNAAPALIVEIKRLRAIEAATRKLFTRGWRCNGPMHVTLTVSDAEYDAVMAALAANENKK